MKFHKLVEHKQGSGGSYFRLKDGESAVVVPRGEIFSFRIKWENGKSTEIPEADPKKHNRFKLNVIVNEGSKHASKIWEVGISLYNNLAELAHEMDITKTKIKVTRRGTGMDTLYVLIPVGQLNASELSNVSAIKLNILGEKTQGIIPDPTFDDMPNFDDVPDPDPEDLPF